VADASRAHTDAELAYLLGESRSHEGRSFHADVFDPLLAFADGVGAGGYQPPPGIRRKSGGAAFDFSGFCDVIDSVLLNAKQRDHLAQVPILTEHRFAGDHRWQSF
jgi:hypothetical protein